MISRWLGTLATKDLQRLAKGWQTVCKSLNGWTMAGGYFCKLIGSGLETGDWLTHGDFMVR